MKCLNCENKVDGKFCSHCGQQSNVGRLTVASFIHEVSESVLQANKGFFYTVKELSTRPGRSLNAYLKGSRKNHFKPIAYLLIVSTLYFLITQFTSQNTWIDDLMSGWMEGMTDQKSNLEVPEMLKWFARNFAYSTLLLLPVFSFASYLSFFKCDLNYLERVVVNAYITGHQALIYSCFALVGIFVESEVLESLPLLLAILYNFWVFWQLFSVGNRAIILLRMVMAYLLYLIFSTGILFMLVQGFDS